jgi:hypothetical protein
MSSSGRPAQSRRGGGRQTTPERAARRHARRPAGPVRGRASFEREPGGHEALQPDNRRRQRRPARRARDPRRRRPARRRLRAGQARRRRDQPAHPKRAADGARRRAAERRGPALEHPPWPSPASRSPLCLGISTRRSAGLPCSASSEGEEPRSVIGRCGDGLGGSGSPIGASSRCHGASRTTASGCWCWDGSSQAAGSGRATSTCPWRGCGRCAASASPPCRRSETSVRHAKRSAPPTDPVHRLRTISPLRGRSARNPHCRRNHKRALRGHAGASPPAVPRDPGPIQRARRRLPARARTPAPDTPPPPEGNDRDGPHIRKRRRPEPARRSGISTRRGQEDDLAAQIEDRPRARARRRNVPRGLIALGLAPADRSSAAA